MVEYTETSKEGGKENVKIFKSSKVGQDIRPIGSDIPKGEVVLKKDQRIGPSELGLLASLGD